MKFVLENEMFAKPVPENAEDMQLLRSAELRILEALGFIREPEEPKPLPPGVVYSTDPKYKR